MIFCGNIETRLIFGGPFANTWSSFIIERFVACYPAIYIVNEIRFIMSAILLTNWAFEPLLIWAGFTLELMLR